MAAPPPLTPRSLHSATGELCDRDADLATIVNTHGPPPMWRRSAGFATMVKLILEQQVSLASAQACYDRLVATLGRVSAAGVSGMTLAEIRECGFTRQKAEYARDLANLITAGGLNLGALRSQPDEVVHRRLVSIRGIGPWTADVYLLMALRRPDVWPDGDVALSESMRVTKRMRKRPDNVRMRRVAANWHPWRSVAARILWHGYLSRRQ